MMTHALTPTLALLLAPAALAQTEIHTVADLQDVALDLTDDYVLMADLDLSGTAMTPLGTPMDPFVGTFDGNGYSISDLYIEDFLAPSVGLFGATDGATLLDITLESPNVRGFQNVGGIAGLILNTDVDSCTVFDGAAFGLTSIGGMFGRTAGSTLDRCRASVDVEGFGRWAGGLVGHVHLNTFLTTCKTKGTVDGGESVGGLCGNIHQSAAFHCDSSATVTGNALVGGLTGWMQENLLTTPAGTSVLLNCSARGDIYCASGGLVTVTDPGGNTIYMIGSGGGLVGWADAYSTIWDCRAYGDVDGPFGTSAPLNGGLVGRAEHHTTIRDCVAYGDVLGGSSTGGFASWTMDHVTIENCTAHGDVFAEWQCGGFIGAFERGELINCHAHGNVNATGRMNSHSDPGRLLAAAGGLVGYTFPSAEVDFGCKIIDCSASGDVQSLGQMTGGLIGLAWGVQVAHSKATGNVRSNERRIGGLVGAVLRSTVSGSRPRCEFLSCYASGDVTQSGTDPGFDGMVGGFIGELQTHPVQMNHLHRSYASGSVNGSGTVGGFAGEVGPDPILYHPCYWDTQTSGQATSALGSGLTTNQMFQQASFTGWNFPFPWTIDEGNDYPRLFWE